MGPACAVCHGSSTASGRVPTLTPVDRAPVLPPGLLPPVVHAPPARSNRRRTVTIAIVVAVLTVVYFVVLWLWGDINQPIALFKNSPRGAAVLVFMVAGLPVLLGLATRRLRSGWLRAAIIILPSGAFIVWTTIPFYVDRVADDALPGAVADVGATDAGATVAAATTAPAAAVRTLEPAAPGGAAAPSPAAEAGPVLLGRGELVGVDHRTGGYAAVYRLADGSHIVRFEDFMVQNGPDFRVVLVPEPGQQNPDGGLELGALEANMGNLNVAIPAGTDVSAYQSVLIWCRALFEPIATATLTAA